jgi:hypothetical protein
MLSLLHPLVTFPGRFHYFSCSGGFFPPRESHRQRQILIVAVCKGSRPSALFKNDVARRSQQQLECHEMELLEPPCLQPPINR